MECTAEIHCPDLCRGGGSAAGLLHPEHPASTPFPTSPTRRSSSTRSWDRSPDIIEDQVTYPIVTALLGAPKVKAIRGFSDFGFSYVYVIFQDGTDIYWARSRVLEYLSKIQPQPAARASRRSSGPDATGVGWVYQYALVDKSGKHNLAELRSLPGLVPALLRCRAFPAWPRWRPSAAFRSSTRSPSIPTRFSPTTSPSWRSSRPSARATTTSGGRLIEFAGAEYMVRGRGYVEVRSRTSSRSWSKTDKQRHARPAARRRPRSTLGPEIRRGVADLDGEGDTVGGIVVMRHGENALNVIERVKAKLEEMKPSLPEGVEIVTTYDRSELIRESIDTLKHELIVEMIIVSLVILIFLWHIPSAIVPIITIPISVLLAFIPMYFLGITSNIMSLAGIAISIGVLVDGAIVEVENAYKKLEHWSEEGRKGDFHEVRLEALKEVGPSVFFSLLVIAVAFLPMFTLVDQEGRLFKPLAYTKNLAMAIAAILAITLDPAVRMLFTRMDCLRVPAAAGCRWIPTQVPVGTLLSGREASRSAASCSGSTSRPCRFVLRIRKRPSSSRCCSWLTTVPVYLQLGREFMPPLERGDHPLHADDAARHLGDRGAAAAADAGPDPESSRRWRASSARPAARRPPPTRRRSR